MKKHTGLKKGLSLVLSFCVIVSCFGCLIGMAIADTGEQNSILREREYLECIRVTPLYDLAPYEDITGNKIVLYLYPGDRMNIWGYFTDVRGGTWWRVNVYYSSQKPELTPTDGYVSTADVKVIHEGP